MPMRVTLDISDVSKMITSRGLQPSGKVQQALTGEIYKQAEPYTPMRSKTLIRTAEVGKDHITYMQPYSRYIYYGKVMVGKPPKRVTNKSSPTTVYIRKNIRREDEFWVYDEQQYSLREYIALQGESINLLKKVAEKMIYQLLPTEYVEKKQGKTDFMELAKDYLNFNK